jgi:segregation and condensation protein B
MEKTVQPETNDEGKRDLVLAEAALYVSGRPIDLKTIGAILGTRSYKRSRAAAKAVVEKYSRQEGALQILELEDERFVMQLKGEYLKNVKRLSIRPLLSQATLQTLAYVAYRQPVAQAHVALMRGGSVYAHIKELKRMGLLSTEKLGKTLILKTTDMFSDYFSLSRNPRLMKRQLAVVFKETKVEEEDNPSSES